MLGRGRIFANLKLEGCAGNGREEYVNCDKDACQADILSALEAAVFGGAPAPIATSADMHFKYRLIRSGLHSSYN